MRQGLSFECWKSGRHIFAPRNTTNWRHIARGREKHRAFWKRRVSHDYGRVKLRHESGRDGDSHWARKLAQYVYWKPALSRIQVVCVPRSIGSYSITSRAAILLQHRPALHILGTTKAYFTVAESRTRQFYETDLHSFVHCTVSVCFSPT